MSTPKTLTLDYTPREAFIPFHNRKTRWAVLLTHRRAGKSVALVNDLVLGALQCKRKNPQFAYIGPTYSQSKRVAWAYLKEAAAPFLAKPPQESELKVTLINGATIYVLGADNADTLRGMYLDGAVLDEYALFKPTVFSTVIRPALSDRLGWAVFASTPRGKNLFHEVFKQAEKDPANWFELTLLASTSGIIPEAELERLRADMDPEEYAQEYECSFDAALKGAIYADQVNEMFADGRVVQEDIYDPKLPLHWAYDIGMTDATVAGAFQIGLDRSVRLVYVKATTGITVMEHIADITRFPGRLGSVWLPHDAKQANNQTGKSVVEQFIEQVMQMPEKRRPRVRGVPLHQKRDGIAATRALFPRITISEAMTGDTVEALKAYRRQWDDNLLMFKDAPFHDWASDYADMVRYMAVAVGIMDREEGGEAISPRAAVRVQELGPRGSVDLAAPHMKDVYLEKMFEDNERKGAILRIS